MSRMSDERRAKRRLLTLYKKGRLRKSETENYYVDNRGIEYTHKWEAMFSSFCNVVGGCLKNGFPVVLPKLWYTAWAFYPFFFVRKDLKVKDPISVLNHERIHIRQQRDIHLTISFPLIVLCIIAKVLGLFNPIYLLCAIPFIPTIIYGIEMLRTWYKLRNYNIALKRNNLSWRNCSFSYIRENTCFERESISRSTNTDYLLTRKFWAVLAYTGWKRFQNYGIK